MKQIYSFFTLLLCLSTVLSLTACGRQPTPADAMASFVTRHPLPAGRVYLSDAAEYEETYLSPSRFELLFARPDGQSDREDIQSYALFFGTSLTTVNEMGIFLCPDRDAAREVVGMLCGRIDSVRRMTEADISHAQDARIELYGNTVIYTILQDNASAIRTLSRILS